MKISQVSDFNVCLYLFHWQAFFQQHPVPGLERSIAQVVENVRTDAKFMMRFEDEMQGEEPSITHR